MLDIGYSMLDIGCRETEIQRYRDTKIQDTKKSVKSAPSD
jgi:hypothetical protein